MQTLGLRIKQLRQAIPLTQLELAEAAGINKSTLNAIETGKRKHPDYRTLEKLAPHLKVTLAELHPASPGSVSEVVRAPSTADISQAVRDALLDLIEDLHAVVVKRSKTGRQTPSARADRSDRPPVR